MNPQTERAAAIVEQYGCKTENLIAILQDIQAAYNYLSEANLTLVAQRLGISVSKVYSVATFYENFSLEAKGRHIIKVCAGTACHVRKSGPIYDAIYEYLGLSGKRKTSDDGMFTLETVACLGACGLAPVMTVDGEVHAKMTPTSALELLERIRDIRASEKVFYRQVLEIYATSIDYDPKAEISIQFFKKVQNKIHYAIHGQTAAEVIYTRADAEKEFMGLTTFAGSQPTLKEAVVAKNYLNEKELRAMGQLVSGYLDFAERQAEREQAMTMQDWSEHLDRILTMSGEQLLIGNGSVSHKQAIDKATGEYRKYKARTLSEVERDYLDSIKLLEQKTDKK